MKANNTRRSARVSAIGPCDVLLGRGTGPNENQGNKMFRNILRKYKESYRTAETKRDKRDIVTTVIEEFKAVGGRFLERVVLPSQQDSSGKHCYEVVDGPAVSLKARQAFRYLLRGVEIDDDQKECHTASTQKALLRAACLPSSKGDRLPTIPCSTVEPTCETSLLSSIHDIVPSQVENHAGRQQDDLTSKDVVNHHTHCLASLTSGEAPMLASFGNSSNYYCPTATSPWRQQELTAPLSFLPLTSQMKNPQSNNPEMLLHAMRYHPESWTTDHANTNGIERFLTNEMIGHDDRVQSYHATISDISQIAAARVKLFDSLLENLLLSPTNIASTPNSLTSSHYRQHFSEQKSRRDEELLESSSRVVEQRNAVVRALIEHHLQQHDNIVAALVVPDLQRIMMMDRKETSRRNPIKRNLLEEPQLLRHGGGGTTTIFLHQIMRGLLQGGDTGLDVVPK